MNDIDNVSGVAPQAIKTGYHQFIARTQEGDDGRQLSAAFTATQTVHWRLDAASIRPTFLDFVGPAIISRQSADGQKQLISMSNVLASMIKVAEREINAFCPVFRIKASALKEGPKIAVIDVLATRIGPQPTLKTLNDRQKYLDERRAGPAGPASTDL